MDLGAARRALEPAAARLGLSIEATAAGVIGIVIANMVRALRAISVERGHDPRDFTLLAFGGAGPLHAGDVARALGIPRFIVPAAPGILCAQGLVVSDLRENFVRSQLVPADDEAEIARIFTELRHAADDWFAIEEVPSSDRLSLASLDMRYVGQNYELSVELDEATATAPDRQALRRLFFAAHERSYGYFNPEDPVEIVNFRLTALGRLKRPEPPAATSLEPIDTQPENRGERPVYFEGDAALATALYHREALVPGHTLAGPAIIEQLDATTLLFPGDRLAVDPAGNLIVEVRA